MTSLPECPILREFFAYHQVSEVKNQRLLNSRHTVFVLANFYSLALKATYELTSLYFNQNFILVILVKTTVLINISCCAS